MSSGSIKKGFGATLGACCAIFLILTVFMVIGQLAEESRQKRKVDALISEVKQGMEYNEVSAILGPAVKNDSDPLRPTVIIWTFPHGIVVTTDGGKVIKITKL